MTQSNTPKKKRYLTCRQVQERYGNVSHMWVERRLDDDADFPRCIKFKRLRMWDEEALDAWDRICAARGRGEHDVKRDADIGVGTKRRPKSKAIT